MRHSAMNRVHTLDGCAIVLAEIGNRLVIWSQAPRQPHQLDVAQSLALKPAARLDPIEIAVDVKTMAREELAKGCRHIKLAAP